MKQRIYFLIQLILGLLIFQDKGFSEGSKELYIGTHNTWLFMCTNNVNHCNNGGDRTPFATFGCTEPDRLYFSTLTNHETVFMGFNGEVDAGGARHVVFDIRDMSGTIVFPEMSLPTTGTGFIPTINEARVGPIQIYGSGGYTAIDFHPATPGTFYIEFAMRNNSGGAFYNGGIDIKLFDITVQDTVASMVKPGRLNSKSWQFYENGQDCSATTYIYSVDSIITSCAFNIMTGGIWVQFCNQWGCVNTNNFVQDRKSRNAQSLLPQFKIFLNNPDIILYPPATTLGQIVPPQPYGIQNCNTGHIDFYVNVDKPGAVEIDLTFAGPYVTRILNQQVVVGNNLITWDGLDGTVPVGIPVPNGINVTFTVKYINGLTNLPFFDIEGNQNGFVVALVNPPGTTPLVYWDDSNLGGTWGSNFTGCLSPPPPGCHIWIGQAGDGKTVNTWWYNVSATTSPINIFEFRHAGTLTFVQPPQSVCAGTNGHLFSVNTDLNTEVYHWSYTGTGATIHQTNPSDYFVTVDFALNATSGSLKVYGTNANCLAPGPTTSLAITINPVPVLNPPSPSTICTGVTTNITLTSVPPSTTFIWTSPVPTCSPNIITCPPGQAGSNLINDVLNLTNSSSGSVVYHIISTLNGCSSTPQDFTLTVLPSPVPVIAGNASVCVGSIGIVYSTLLGMTGYTWTISGGGSITTGLGTNSITVNWNTVGAQTVSVGYTDVNSCTTLTPTVYNVTVNPLPTAIISGTTAVCQNSASPLITFTGASSTAPYTFTYNINGLPDQTVTTTVGNSVTIAAPTNTVGAFTYNLVSVQDGGSPACSQAQTGNAVVTVNPLPTATISGTITVCQNSASPLITFTGASSTAPYTFTYNINGLPDQIVTTTVGNSVTVAAPTNIVGTFTYNLVSVQDGSPTTCSQAQSGSADVTVNTLPTATIAGTITVCQNSASPLITFTGASTTAPYTFTYNINGLPNQTVTTTVGNSVTVAAPTNAAGTFTYNLVSVQDGSPTSCSQAQAGSAVVTVNPLPTATISGTITVCQNSASPLITFIGASSTAPYTFTYNINGLPNQTVTTIVGNSVTVAAPTNILGIFSYNLVSVQDGSSTLCSQAQAGSAVVTVSTLPSPTISGLNTICSGDSTSYITQIGMNNYLWQVSAGGTIIAGGSTTDNFVTITWNTAGAQTVSVNYSMAGCTASQPFVYNVTVKPRPLVTNAANSTTCSNVPISIALLATLPGTTFTWTAAGSSGNVSGFSASGGLVISQTLINSGFNIETVDYAVTPSLNGCDGLIAHYIVTVDPVADAYFNPNGQSFCSGGTSSISILSHVAGATFIWNGVGSSGNISGFGPGATSSISQTLTNIGTGPETVTYTISPSFNSCPGTPNSVVVTVNPLPSVTYTICNDVITTTAAQPIRLRGGIPLGGTYTGTGVNTGIFYPSIAGTGNHTITYSYPNTWGCAANATQMISVVNPAVFLCDNPMTDIRDNKQYPTVKLGTQCWMAANLNYGTFIVSAQMQRDNCVFEKYCYTDNLANCTSYGGLYQWDELMQYDIAAAAQGFCPPGWHVPTENEWTTLFNFYISNGFAGAPLKYSGYSGFNAFLSGTRFNNVNFYFNNFAVMFWSSNTHGADKAWAHGMNTFNPSVSYYPSSRTHAFNLRCIKD